MKRIFKFAILLVFIALIIWVFVYLYQQSKTAPVVYETETPVTTNILRKTVATGSVVPRKEIAIKPQESGIVTAVYVEPGQLVKQGDNLARIQIIPEMVQVNEAENRVNKARLAFANAEKEFERTKQLYEQQVVALFDFQTEELRFKSSREDLQAAENHLQLIQEGVTKQMGSKTNTVIRSTISGMVLDVPIEEGNSVIKSNNGLFVAALVLQHRLEYLCDPLQGSAKLRFRSKLQRQCLAVLGTEFKHSHFQCPVGPQQHKKCPIGRLECPIQPGAGATGFAKGHSTGPGRCTGGLPPVFGW